MGWKLAALAALSVMGCLSDRERDPQEGPVSLDGLYQSGFIDERPSNTTVEPRGSARKDMLILAGDSLEYYICNYGLNIHNGVPVGDTVREVQFSGGRYEITGDSITMIFTSYGRTGDLPKGEISVETLSFDLEPHSHGVRRPVKVARNRIDLLFDFEFVDRWVAFHKIARLKL